MESKVGFIIGRQTLDAGQYVMNLTSNVQRLSSYFSGVPRLRRARDHVQVLQQ